MISLFLVACISVGVLASNGGGAECAACTIITGLLEQKVALDSTSIENELDTLCAKLGPMKVICDVLVNTYGKLLIEAFNKKETPDKICHDYIKMCTDPQCVLFDKQPAAELASARLRKRATGASGDQSPVNGRAASHGLKIDWPWQWAINRIGKEHLPVFDTDNDYFSTVESLRGSRWRGKDCNDDDASVYPGRLTTTHPATVDHNCNGIYEIDGVDYEKKFCDGTGAIGVGVIGDSASAHFEIPPSYFNASEIDTGTYDGALSLFANEIDWPWRSTVTGYQASSPEIPVSSIYQKVRELNLCSHRDYQNIGVNGARAGAANSTLVHGLGRHQTTDRPMLLFLSLIGNDVCDHVHSVDHFTPADQFYKETLGTLTQLDKMLPPNSHVMTVGLASGDVLWNSLHNRIHPIGVTYRAVYDFLNCLDISPCWCWMNSNATVRAAGDAHAALLSSQYQKIIDSHKFKNFDLGYLSFVDVFANVTKKWEQQGGHLWELIEPVDGFHPNQIGQALLGEEIWANMQKYYPTWIPKANPNNADIVKKFGEDLNGY